MTNHAAANISIFQIQLFLSVAKHRSFSAAAVENNIEQSNLSRQIARLEDYLNVSLFIRSSHPIRLTKEGETLRGLWEPLMEAFDYSVHALEKSANSLTICISDSISMINDIHSLREFVAEKLPEFDLQFLFCPIAEYTDYLTKGTADAAITIYIDEAPGSDLFEYYKIRDCLMTVSMLKTNPLSGKNEFP
ncbi:MAG: LysR family transcriptional regulator [Lachnospiraceae bacterium]|nr:LysR family transcriptional regulator [Lachnospiraceae bacterium]